MWKVTAKFDTDGIMMPVSFIWEDGTVYQIDRIKAKERCASRKADLSLGHSADG